MMGPAEPAAPIRLREYANMAMQIIGILFELAGALALFIFGMQLSSNGIQLAAGDRLQRAVNLMTRNSAVATVTGVVITILLQSSSAATVMVVSFVNAGLLNLVQAIGVIMGSNIGTTLTGWIIAAVGVQKFSIAALAVPIFGVGFFLSLIKHKRDAYKGYGETLMGFAMIFLGLEYVGKAIPDPSPDALLVLRQFAGQGWIAIAACVGVGIVFTMMITASSATLAITIGLAAKGVLSWEMAAAITLGANIGTTLDSFLVSLGANVHAKRAAWAHILFNTIGTVWVLIIFKPFLWLVDWITPGPITAASMGAHIAMLHTMFNTANTLILLPLVRPYAKLMEKLIPEKPAVLGAEPTVYSAPAILPSPELNLVRARKEIADFADLAAAQFGRTQAALMVYGVPRDALVAEAQRVESYADTVQENLTRYLLEVSHQDVNEKSSHSIQQLLRLVNELETITDNCFSVALLLDRLEKKQLRFDDEEVERLEPYSRLVGEFLSFVRTKIGQPLGDAELKAAGEFEERIDSFRDELKRLARKRLKSGKDVRAQLWFIDAVRMIEKIGDNAFAIAETLRELN
jgi:phosphate:Na+ symporter